MATQVITKIDKDESINRHTTYGKTVSNYIENIAIMNKSTADEYLIRLRSFEAFLANDHGILNSDNIINRIKEGDEDSYSILSRYAAYLRKCNISAMILKQRVVTIKNFFEYYDVDISPRKFKLKVKLPKIIRKNKEALSKEDIIDILNACSDIRLKTYVMLLAGTGMRAVEALSIRIKDIDHSSNPVKLFVRGEYTKTKADRTIFLTEEITLQLKSWLEYKYRTRRVCHKDDKTKETITEYRTPIKTETDLVFAVYQSNITPDPVWIYQDLTRHFVMTLDRMGKGTREDGNERRRKITLHSFRRFVKTTISDLGYSDFSEYFIGHYGSAYWQKKDSEKAELFRKIEPYLTFLNIHHLERQGADIQSKVQELEEVNQSLRQSDKVKDDALSQLSDQLMALTSRLQDLERKQQH